MPVKHIQLSPFITKTSDCFPLLVGKLSFHNMKEFWNRTTTCQIENIKLKIVILFKREIKTEFKKLLITEATEEHPKGKSI